MLRVTNYLLLRYFGLTVVHKARSSIRISAVNLFRKYTILIAKQSFFNVKCDKSHDSFTIVLILVLDDEMLNMNFRYLKACPQKKESAVTVKI